MIKDVVVRTTNCIAIDVIVGHLQPMDTRMAMNLESPMANQMVLVMVSE